ncbi:hypothetical protein [Nostoc sp. 'Peltigera malacea cyanobiont' DB3992]|uniref:hypothetical protein n=1 Tax=Nostoc sp. 'Peltigera malacea cyanobiont' DB3992 TaxID=1206980 RepID=UPI00117DCF95|nr:hypothetical protein [Nostoc sp. 'Peltigera malacea cyanobiont' DB3992]
MVSYLFLTRVVQFRRTLPFGRLASAEILRDLNASFKHFEDITNLGIAASHQQPTLPSIYRTSICCIDFI